MIDQPSHPRYFPPPVPPPPRTVRTARALLRVQGGLGLAASFLALIAFAHSVKDIDTSGRGLSSTVFILLAAIGLPLLTFLLSGAVLFCASHLLPGRPGIRRGVIVLEVAGILLCVFGFVFAVGVVSLLGEPVVLLPLTVPLLIAFAVTSATVGCLLNPGARAYCHIPPPLGGPPVLSPFS